MNQKQQAIRTLVEDFVGTLSELIRQAALESVTQALGGDAAPRRRGGRGEAAGKPARRAKGQKRTPEELANLVELVTATIGAHPGSRVERLAEILEMNSKELQLPIRKLLEDKVIGKKGQKRATTYTLKNR